MTIEQAEKAFSALRLFLEVNGIQETGAWTWEDFRIACINTWVHGKAGWAFAICSGEIRYAFPFRKGEVPSEPYIRFTAVDPVGAFHPITDRANRAIAEVIST